LKTLFFSSLLNWFIDPAWVESLTTTIHRHPDIRIQFIETNDIWCRDFFPIQVGRNKFVQFALTKDYYSKKKKQLQTDPAPICQMLGIKTITPSFNGLPIYLDGGNVIRKFNKVIITDKIFKDNKIPPVKLVEILNDFLEVDKVILIPKEPGEDSGHSDGMVRFINQNTVLINDYSGVDTNHRFVNKLHRTLKESGLTVIEVPYKPQEGRINGLQPSTGIYVNYLQIDNMIFLPTFDDPVTDDHAIAVFESIFGSGNIIPVPSKELSLMGGVLNCCSWEIDTDSCA